MYLNIEILEKITMDEERKQQLKRMSFVDLQMTKEFKDFEEFFNSSLMLVNEEINFILNSSEADKPFDFEDIQNLRGYDMSLFDDFELEIRKINEIGKSNILQELAEYLNVDENVEKIIEEVKELEYEEKIRRVFDIINTNSTYDCEFVQDLEEYEVEKDIMQWFIITNPQIISILRKEGEPILDNKYWGRCSFGQAVTMDGIIVNKVFKNWYLEKYDYFDNI